MKNNAQQRFPLIDKNKANVSAFSQLLNTQKQADALKARSFLQRKKTFNDPLMTFHLIDQIRQQTSSYYDENYSRFAKKQNIPQLKKEGVKNLKSLHEVPKSKTKYSMNSTFLPQITSQLLYKRPKFKINKQRQQVLSLADWIDKKLSGFRKKQYLSLDDIFVYRQTVINYGLGKIISNVTKQCKQQGQLLQIIWDNTFSIFQCLLGTISKQAIKRQKQSLQSQKEQQQIFNQKLKFEEQKMRKVAEQNELVFDKMKSVILWNKNLRKERKEKHIQNRILNYRLETYIEGLEQAINLLLKSTPESKNITFAKNIIQKLAIEKRRKKKKSFVKKQAYKQYLENSKTVVYNWLRRNCFQTSEQQIRIFHESMNNQEFMDDFIGFEQEEDRKKMKEVSISEYFKLIDIGFQTEVQTKEDAAQYDPFCYRSIAIGTDPIYKYDESTQTKGVTIQLMEQQERNDKRSLKSHNSKQSRLKSGKKSTRRNQKQQPNSKQMSRVNFKGGNPSSSTIRKFNIGSSEHINASSVQKISSSGFKRYQTFVQQDQLRRPSSAYLDECDEEHDIISSTRSFKRQPSLFNHMDDNKYSQFSISTNRINHFFGKKDDNNLVRKNMRINSVNFQKISENRIDDQKLQFFGKTFNEQYQENKKRMNLNKQNFLSGLRRRRSFHRQSNISFPNRKLMDENYIQKKTLYRGNFAIFNRPSEVDYSNVLQNTLQNIGKKSFTGSNLAKSKAFQASHMTFQTVAQSVFQNKPSAPPKNKQFFQSSLAAITKKISHLFEDYLKQLRREKQGISVDFGKIYYPLRVLLVEQMNCKYGLRDIADKKLKDLIEKITTFAQASEKIQLYRKLLGMQNENVGADQLMLYLKCLVYYDFKNAYLNFGSQVVKNSVEQQVLLQFLPKVAEQFFNPSDINIIKQKLSILYEGSANNVSVEAIALILIDYLLEKKQQLRGKYTPIYNFLIQGNFFSNLYSFLNMIKHLGIRKQLKIHKCLEQFFKKADLMDQVHGKTISENRFILCCIILQLPQYKQADEVFQTWRKKVLTSMKTKGLVFAFYSLQNYRKVLRTAQNWKLSQNYQRVDDPVRWKWFTNRILFNKTEATVLRTIGLLNIWNNQINEYLH